MKKYGAWRREWSNEKCSEYPTWLHWFLLYPMQQAEWWTSTKDGVENVWCMETCIAKTNIWLLWSNMLTKEWILVLKTYYATDSYRRVKEEFYTEFPNSTTTLSDFSILWLVRKFKEAGSIQDKPRKGRPHTATTMEHVESEQRWAVTILCKYTDFVRFSEFHLCDLCLIL